MRPFKRHRQPRTLIDRAASVQLGGHVGAADQMHGFPHRQQRLLQLAARFLPGADDHRVYRQTAVLLGAGDVQSFVVDQPIADAVEHFHAAHRQAGAVDPTGGFPQAFAHLAGFAL